MSKRKLALVIVEDQSEVQASLEKFFSNKEHQVLKFFKRADEAFVYIKKKIVLQTC